MKLSFLRQINACICLDRYEGGKGYCITVSKGAFPDQSPNKNLAGLTSARFFCFVETFARRLAYILFVNSLYNRELFCIFEY